eukprot:TRINITY_DN3980_c0_g1_i3.p1 TRINITY_DN3980_c0_g1~~TRINITY_DN3980_c0_g1_i3.p1  ORF type:complete len:358 (+),score=108.75 TRINITY_DN3980_c0_g1_i3:213-1286(+)
MSSHSMSTRSTDTDTTHAKKRSVDEVTKPEHQKEKKEKKDKGKAKTATEHATTELTHQQGHTRTTEEGHVIFFYRVKVDAEEAHSANDVQKLYLLLVPKTKGALNRLVVMPRKKLPHKGEKAWAFVEDASSDIVKIDHELAEYHYNTKTKGERTLQGARICGEGVYSLIAHDEPRLSKSAVKIAEAEKKAEESHEKVEAPTTGATVHHVHFAYVLELPTHIGEVQSKLDIEKEGNFIISVKNPASPTTSFGGLAPGAKAEYAKTLQDKFEGKKFIPLDPPVFLDHKGAELLFIGTGKEITEDLGKDGEKLEKVAENEEEHGVHGCELSSEQIFNDLKMPKEEQKQHPTKGLTTGEFE